MKKGDKANVSPRLTGENDWIGGEVIDVEKNPFRGIIISIKDESGRIFFGEEKYFRHDDDTYIKKLNHHVRNNF
ncbi:MAG: hypothetical protein LBK94_03170 [Prevotellaceae bacterium]|jgi:hypothetical protein|nr:hypothetical protein [Prevotellaceae bacterium]